MQGTSLMKQERDCKLYDEFDKFAYKKGESLHEFYLIFSLLLNDMNIYNMKLEQFQVNTKFLNTLPPEWSKFVTDVKLVRDLHTTNIDQLHAYLGQHEFHANEVRLMHERNSDPLALVATHQMTQYFKTILHEQVETILENKEQLFATTAKGKATCPNNATNQRGKGMIHGLRINTALSEVHNHDNVNNDMTNQVMQAMSSSEQLMLYKEQVIVLKEGQNVDLKSQDNVSDSCSQSIEIDHLKRTLSEHLKEKESLLQTVTLLKNDFKKEESRNLDREIALEKQIKHLDNIKAQQLEPMLYVGDIIQNTNPIVIPDLEETLTLAEESRSKMHLKHKDNMSYNSVSSSEPDLSDRPTNVEVPKELPKVSMVNTSLKKLKYHLANFDVEIFQRDNSISNQSAPSFDQLFELNELKAQSQEKDMVIKKLKERIKSLNGNMDKDKIKQDLEEIETINIELDHREKVLVITTLKDELRKLKGKYLANNEVIHHPSDPKINTKPITPKLLNKRSAHSAYIKHTQEEAAVLRDLVDHIKANYRLDLTLESACNTKKDKILQTQSSTQTNKVEAHPRKVKSSLKNKDHVVAPKGTAHVQYSKLNANSELKCVKYNGCMLSDNHDLCVFDYINNVNARAKSKSAKKQTKRKVWKPTGKMFTTIRYIWRPTSRTFTIVGNACPLTRITTTIEAPIRKPVVLDNETSKPAVTLVYSRKPRNSKTNVLVSKYKVLQYVSANKKEPSKSWGSIIFDVPSSSLNAYRSSKLSSGLGHNLFSITQFCDSNLEVAFRQHTCFIRNLEGVDLLTGSRGNNLYTLSLRDMMTSSPICLLSKASKTKSWLWHRRLSHLNFGAINHLARHGLVRGLPKLKFEKDHMCSACAMGKSKKKPHKPKSKDTNQEKLYLLHMDLCGPIRVASVNGKKYILVIVDDYSRFTWVKFLRTDNGTEFVNQTLREYYEKVDISHETSVAHSPQQNGVVERRNRTLIEDARTMLIYAKALLFLWAEAVTTACYTQNRSIIRLCHGKTPYELLHDKLPDLSFLLIFSRVTAMASEHNNSGPALHEMTPITISSGLVPNPPPSTPFVPPSRTDWDMLFQPNEVAALEPAVSTGSPSSTTVDQVAPSPSNSQTTPDTQSPVIPNDVKEDNHDIKVKHMGNDPYFGIPILEVSSDQSSSSDSIHRIVHPDHQISKHNNKWTKDHPLKNIIDVYRLLWTQACGSSIARKNSMSVRTVLMLWGVRTPTRLSYGYYCEVDYNVKRRRTGRRVAKISGYKGFFCFMFAAFMNEHGRLPNGCEDCLKKALYGLKQAPRAWYDMFSSFLISQDFSKGSVDPTLFIPRDGKELILVQIYVDDIIFAAFTPELCDLFSKITCSKFKMSIMGKISFFLGLQISQSPRGIFINQSKYALESLKKYGFDSCDPVDTPMVEKSKLDEDKEGKAVDPSHYYGMIGTILYLTARTVNRGLWYPKDSSIALTAFADADHVGCQDTRRSTSDKNGVIKLYFVKTEYQLADIFTKALGRERIEFLINKLGMQSFMPETLKQLANEVDE
ncbi:retrovirus-related pol polyprotein from transposon TNT 1-94 [Tanacetum coccineum]